MLKVSDDNFANKEREINMNKTVNAGKNATNRYKIAQIRSAFLGKTAIFYRGLQNVTKIIDNYKEERYHRR